MATKKAKKKIIRSARTSCATFGWPVGPWNRKTFFSSSPPSVPSPVVTRPCYPVVVVVVVVVVVGLLQIIIQSGWAFAKDHPEGPPSCK